MKKIKCKVCEFEFIPDVKNHYISRDSTKYGLIKLAGDTEENLYDTFDCPQCGCQNIVGDRKRSLYTGENILEQEMEDEESDEVEYEDIESEE